MPWAWDNKDLGMVVLTWLGNRAQQPRGYMIVGRAENRWVKSERTLWLLLRTSDVIFKYYRQPPESLIGRVRKRKTLSQILPGKRNQHNWCGVRRMKGPAWRRLRQVEYEVKASCSHSKTLSQKWKLQLKKKKRNGRGRR